MELRTLRYFAAVVEAGSFSKAASHLLIAQPALSRQVQKLEAEVGTPLLMRTGRGLELTDAGVLMLERAQSLLRQSAQAMEEVRMQGAGMHGVVTIGTSLATGSKIAPKLLQFCKEHFPRIRIDLVEGFSGYIYDRFVRGELNICLLHNLPGRSDIVIDQIGEEQLYLVGAPQESRSEYVALNGAAWAEAPLILPSRTHSLRVLLESAAHSRALELDVRYQVDGLSITKELIAHGMGMSVLGFNSVERELLEQRLTAVPLRNPALTWTLGLAARHEQRRLPSVQAVLRAIQTVLPA
jgi:LysR family nitrogen assimilation transcriptional regulator